MLHQPDSLMTTILVALFIVTQGLWLLTFLIDFYIFRLPINKVDMREAETLADADIPPIVLFYPVLRELKGTMRTTMLALAETRYPRGKLTVVAIPNLDDHETIGHLRELCREFAFLELLLVPPTSDPSWAVVWNAWTANRNAYWWHRGLRAGNKDLPPKKTRQLIYAFYQVASQRAGGPDFLVNYIDANSCPQRDHFMAAAVGMRHFDVLQASNIAGNLNDTFAASLHAMDHMAWDGRKFPHLTANGTQPYWMLGKGLYYRASDLIELGGWHPWITIEDPEVGMRFWANGRRLGYIEEPLIEEVPRTFAHGITQRKRWVAGFFQTLDVPMRELGYTPIERLKAWAIFLPCLSYLITPIGLPVGGWAIYTLIEGDSPLPPWTITLAIGTSFTYLLALSGLYLSIWRRSEIVLERRVDRLRYLVRVNPLSLVLWSMIWVIPIIIGWWMYIRDTGLVWERTVKVDANAGLIRSKVRNPPQ